MNVHAKDNDLIAHELFMKGEFGSAAEVFSDPAWKGVALYRSEQWWRAAETFVRGNDAPAFHNLGNTYVRLGYYELALEAYQRALKYDPNFEDAEFNAQLMKDLIALRKNNNKGKGLQQPESLGEVAKDNDEVSSAGSPEGGEKADAPNGESEQKTNSGEQTTSERAAEAESGPAAESNEDSNSNTGDQGTSTVSGIESNLQSEQNASGNSNSSSDAGKARSAGQRLQIEAEQATEQWLNRIEHNPILFLQRHIELETRRRRRAGQQAPEGGDGW